MPLATSQLKSDLATLAASPGASPGLAAAKWADAMEAYAANVVPPSTAVVAAADALETALETAFATPAAAPGMELAFTAFGAAIAAGMPPGATAPPGPVGFAAQFAGPHPTTHADAGDQVGTIIDVWMRTGTANGSTPWS